MLITRGALTTFSIAIDVTKYFALAPESAVTREAQKGYGLLGLGVAKTVAPHGGFHEQISRIAAMFEGLLAVVVARGAHLAAPEEGSLNILVPVRGSKVSRRAAEVAFALTRPGDRPPTALYVLGTVGLSAAQRCQQGTISISVGLSAIFEAATILSAQAQTSDRLRMEAKLSIEEARSIALKLVPGKIMKEELERERGGSGLRYSFDIRQGKKWREVGVDAKIGRVLENSAESPNPKD